jgi:membrane associated rhomboid family serine protease
MAVIRPVAPRMHGWLGAGAALALLAMLGSGGPRVDILAHLFGFTLGSPIGLLAARAGHRPAAPMVQWCSGFAALALLICSWILALR